MKLRKSKNKRIIKLATKFQPWDFGFNLEMEKAMFERMYEFFSSTAPVVAGAERVDREIKLAINLLNIIMEEDTATVWVRERGWRLVKYVNTKNANRFGKFSNLEEVLVKDYLRQSKAWYLYHKLRCYKMQHWWD